MLEDTATHKKPMGKHMIFQMVGSAVENNMAATRAPHGDTECDGMGARGLRCLQGFGLSYLKDGVAVN